MEVPVSSTELGKVLSKISSEHGTGLRCHILLALRSVPHGGADHEVGHGNRAGLGTHPVVETRVESGSLATLWLRKVGLFLY